MRAAGDLNGDFLDKLCLAFQVEMNEAPLAKASTLTSAAIRDTFNSAAPYQAVGTHTPFPLSTASRFYVLQNYFFIFLAAVAWHAFFLAQGSTVSLPLSLSAGCSQPSKLISMLYYCLSPLCLRLTGAGPLLQFSLPWQLQMDPVNYGPRAVFTIALVTMALVLCSLLLWSLHL